MMLNPSLILPPRSRMKARQMLRVVSKGGGCTVGWSKGSGRSDEGEADAAGVKGGVISQGGARKVKGGVMSQGGARKVKGGVTRQGGQTEGGG